MLDRLTLSQSLTQALPELSSADNLELRRVFDALIAQLILRLPLAAAQSLSTDVKMQMEIAFDEVMTFADLKRLSKAWDPVRFVSAGTAQSELVEDLAALLHGARAPFSAAVPALARLTSLDARGRKRLLDEWGRFASDAQLKSLLKESGLNHLLNAKADRSEMLSAYGSFLQKVG